MLTHGRVVGNEDDMDDGVPFEEKFIVLKEKLINQFEKSSKLEREILDQLQLINHV